MSVMVEAALKGGTYIWGAPTFDQVRIGFNETRHAAVGVADFNLSRMTATFPPNNGRIIYRSLDNPDNARGYTADGVGIDEAGDVKEAAWYEVLRPMLIDTGGWSWTPGTPKGRNWFWREWLAAKERPDSTSWQIPTLGCRIVEGELFREPHPLENPDIPWPEIEHIFQTVPQMTFRQEIMAEFLENEGTVFRNIGACLGAPMGAKPADHAGHRIVVGLDWGKQADFTVCSIGCATCKVELALDRFNQIDYHYQRKRVESLVRPWRPTIVLAEKNAMGEPIIDEMIRGENGKRGLPVIGFQTTATSKPPLIESLSLTFERAEWQFLDIPVATGELEAYERRISPTTGRSSYGAPEGLHDDTVMARALMHKAGLSSGEIAEEQPRQRSRWQIEQRRPKREGSRWKI